MSYTHYGNDCVDEISNGMEEDRTRFITNNKMRQLPWLCLGDVRPHFEKLKGSSDSPTHVTTDDSASDDCTSDDEVCFVETKVPKNTDISPMEYNTSSRFRSNDDHYSLSVTQEQSYPSSEPCPWNMDIVPPIIVPHLVHCNRRSSKINDVSHTLMNLTDRQSRIVSYHSREYDTGTTDLDSYMHGPSCKKSRKNQDLVVVPEDIHKSITQTKRRASVTMYTRVSVIPIPARDEYSPRVRESLWSSSTEMSRNITRNSIEFASEGWDWRNVTEDEEMLVHDVSGELIHPIHLQNTLALIGANEDLFSSQVLLKGADSLANVPVVSPPNFD